MSYSLAALYKVREYKKHQAENGLRQALQCHENERLKLKEIKDSLVETVSERMKLQQNFFFKSRLSGCNRSELNCHALSTEKKQIYEGLLKKNLAEQEEIVRFAALKISIAETQMLEAHRNLKLIEKHYDSWKRSQYKAEQMIEEKVNDDLNCTNYIIKKA
jgi:hypothetical protein